MTAPRMRAGDSDRQSVVDRLTTHFTEGRLDPNEYDERVQKAYAAAYLDEFSVLFDDLPEAPERGGRGWYGQRGSEQPGAGSAGPGAGWAGAGWGPMGPGWGGPGRGPGLRPGGPWGGRPPLRRPPAILAVLAAVIAVMVLSAVVTGLFFVGFPLFWIGLAVFLFTRGGCHRRWANGHSGGRSGGGRY
jgi:hypothetical protein